MRGRRQIMALLATLAMAALAPSAHAETWAELNCDGGGASMQIWKRSQAAAYSEPMANEGYEWNGGCYRINDIDDTAGWPVDSGGEGADCSGFVFRVWGLKADGTLGFRYWDYDKEIHGPYYTWHYFEPEDTDPFRLISKTYRSTMYMDALVYIKPDGERHVALIKAEGKDGWDYVIHARNNTDGTTIDYMPYRSYAESKAVERKDWTPDCWPKCPTQ